MSNAGQRCFVRYGDKPENYDEIDPWAVDLAPQRKELAQSLTALFRGSDKPFVLAVNAGWGMGKSLFLHMWRDDLQNRGHPCLLFNAWEYDHTKSPLFSFLTALDHQVNTGWKGKLKRKGRQLLQGLPKTIPGLVNMAAQFATPTPEPQMAKTAGQAAETAAKGLLEMFRDAAEDRRKFREQLRGFAAALTKDGQSPLIVMVDELDRCRPDFAIALLEDIKHLFSVEGIVFVLAVEKTQLANCIGASYGLDAAGAQAYLGKFIDMTMELPAPDRSSFIRLLQQTYPLPDPPQWPRDTPGHSLPSFATVAEQILGSFSFSLRDLAQVLCRLSLILAKPDIHPLAAVSCVLLLAHVQRGGSIEEGIKEEIESYEAGLKPVLAPKRHFSDEIAPYLRAVKAKLNDSVLELMDARRVNDNSGRKSHLWLLEAKLINLVKLGPKGLEWKEYLYNHLLLLQNISV